MTRVLRELKQGELTLKDMYALREGASAKEQHGRTNAQICDYSLQHVVTMRWGGDFSEARRDLRPFELRIDSKKYLLSWGELKDMDSAGFFRREPGNPRYYQLHYFDGTHVTVDTDLNDEATRDMIVRFSGRDWEVFLDWYEVLRAGRFI